jgi:dTDP-4-dehydrorhamnose 3,5-epimerase
MLTGTDLGRKVYSLLMVVDIVGIKYFDSVHNSDIRGTFTKSFSVEWFKDFDFELREVFYSRSKQGVVRGLHMQTGFAAGPRIVHTQAGRILDVLLDLRKESPTYLNLRAQEMSPTGISSVFIPAGVAHGFQALEESLTLYLSSKVYVPSLDTGIDSLSIHFDWPLETIVRSERDKALPSIVEWIRNEKNDQY